MAKYLFSSVNKMTELYTNVCTQILLRRGVDITNGPKLSEYVSMRVDILYDSIYESMVQW